MTIYFITRHQGAIEWAAQQGLKVDKQLEHLDPSIIKQNDTVMGSLPVNIAADICERGGCYLHLSLDLPQAIRGKELSAKDMSCCNARLEEFTVIRKSLEQKPCKQ